MRKQVEVAQQLRVKGNVLTVGSKTKKTQESKLSEERKDVCVHGFATRTIKSSYEVPIIGHGMLSEQ